MDQQNSREYIPRFHVSYIMDEQDIDACLRVPELKRSKLRYLVQTAILLVVFIAGLSSILGEGDRNAQSVFTTVASLLVIGLIWTLPAWNRRHTARTQARELAERGLPLRISFFEEDMVFYGQEPVHISYKDAAADRVYDVIVLTMDKEVLAIPKRVMAEEDWQWLLQSLKL